MAHVERTTTVHVAQLRVQNGAVLMGRLALALLSAPACGPGGLSCPSVKRASPEMVCGSHVFCESGMATCTEHQPTQPWHGRLVPEREAAEVFGSAFGPLWSLLAPPRGPAVKVLHTAITHGSCSMNQPVHAQLPPLWIRSDRSAAAGVPNQH